MSDAFVNPHSSTTEDGKQAPDEPLGLSEAHIGPSDELAEGRHGGVYDYYDPCDDHFEGLGCLQGCRTCSKCGRTIMCSRCVLGSESTEVQEREARLHEHARLAARRDYAHHYDVVQYPYVVKSYEDMVEVKRRWGWDGMGRVGGGRRGAVRGFSSASRRRFTKRMAQVRDANWRDALMLTWTWPDDFPADDKEYKRVFNALKRRLVRKWPDCRGFWRQEPVARKSGENAGAWASHFHAAAVGLPVGAQGHLPLPQRAIWRDFVSDRSFVKKAEMFFSLYRERYGKAHGLSKRWRSDWWACFVVWWAWAVYEVIGSDDLEHLFAGTSAERARSKNGLRWYLAKYVSKNALEDDDLAIGRRWGTWGNLDTRVGFSYALSREQASRLQRMVVSWLRSRGHGDYAAKLAGRQGSWFCLGLGDGSFSGWADLFESTIARMLLDPGGGCAWDGSLRGWRAK